jgi:hypothetical protein
VVKQLRDHGEEALYLHPHPQTSIALATCRKLEDLVRVGLDGVTLKDLVVHCHEQDGLEAIDGILSPEVNHQQA